MITYLMCDHDVSAVNRYNWLFGEVNSIECERECEWICQSIHMICEHLNQINGV